MGVPALVTEAAISPWDAAPCGPPRGTTHDVHAQGTSGVCSRTGSDHGVSLHVWGLLSLTGNEGALPCYYRDAQRNTGGADRVVPNPVYTSGLVLPACYLFFSYS